MRTVPVFFAVTTPFASTIATLELLLLKPYSRLALEGVGVTASVTVWPFVSHWPGDVIFSAVGAAFSTTVTWIVRDTPLS